MKKSINNTLSDNRGAALISVVVAIMFIVVIGTALLYSALTGMNVKAAERKTDDSFYDAETVLDEIRAGVALQVSGAMESAYTDTFSEFAAERLNGVHPQTLLAEKMLEELTTGTSVDVALIGSDGKTYSVPKLVSFVSGKPHESGNSRAVDVDGGTAYINFEGAGLTGVAEYTAPVISEEDSAKYTVGSITLKDVDVRFISDAGYESDINTDIVINIPDFYARAVAAAGSISGFSLSTDGRIISDVSNGRVTVTGDVFARGNGTDGSVYIGNGSSLTLSGGNAYFGGAVNVGTKEKGGSLSFGKDGADELWAKEIVVGSGSNTNTHEVELSANAYVQDDLLIQSGGSKVTLSGSYTGFGAGKTGDKSSAIVINGKSVNLDFTGLDNLTLAGVGYIDIFKTRDSELGANDYNTNNGKNVLPNDNSIPMGQSMVAKSDQLAYLVPAECLKNYPTNPYYFTFTGTGDLPDPEPDLTAKLFADSSNKKTLGDYVSQAEIKTLYKVLDNQTKTYVAYVFMVFNDQSKANAYFKDYFSAYPERVATYLKNYIAAVDDLSDADASVATKGNIYYTEDGKLAVKLGNSASNGSYYSTLFTTYTTNNPYNRLINASKVSALTKGVHTFEATGGKGVIVKNSTYTYSAGSNVKYIVGYNSTITIGGSFTGSVISGGNGNIELKGNVTFSDEASSVMSATGTKSEGAFGDYFNGVGGSGSDNNSWNLDRIVTYANWAKN